MIAEKRKLHFTFLSLLFFFFFPFISFPFLPFSLQSIKGTVLSRSRRQAAEARGAAALASCQKPALGETGKSQQSDTAIVLSRSIHQPAKARVAAAMASCQKPALERQANLSQQSFERVVEL